MDFFCHKNTQDVISISHEISSSLNNVQLKIHNVLALAQLECDERIILENAVKLFVNAMYVPDSFPALRIEVKGNITGAVYTVSLFDNGRIQSAGGVMPREAGLAMKRVVKRLKKALNIKIAFKNFTIHNLLGVVDLNTTINLDKLHSFANLPSDYDQSKFPALRLSISIPKEISNVSNDNYLFSVNKRRKVEQVTASIFKNGKINFVGGRSVRSIQYCINEIIPLINAS